jgi:hypothetical protein
VFPCFGGEQVTVQGFGFTRFFGGGLHPERYRRLNPKVVTNDRQLVEPDLFSAVEV